MKKEQHILFYIFCILLLSGCVNVLVAGAGGAVSYTFTNVAYKTLTFPIERVESANRRALDKMGIKYTGSTETENGVKIFAETSELEIHIELERITPKTTKISVDAKKNIVMKDKSTAAAIIEVTEAMLEKE